MSREARKYVRNFDHLKIARRYAELLRCCVEEIEVNGVKARVD
jgi:hypothetical protein